MILLLDAPTTRWASRTPLGFAAGDANLYRFVFNNPVNLTDPSGLAAVGHHWIPIGVLTDPEIRALLSDEAFELALGSYSGQTNPNHCFGTYGGISHAKYRDVVKEELLKYLKGKKQLSFEDMKGFIDKIEYGLDRLGNPNKDLKAFNDAIRGEREAYIKGGRNRRFTIEQTPAQRRKQGQSYLKNPRVMLGAVLASLVSGAISEAQGAIDVASKSAHFRVALRALSNGDLSEADRHFFGAGDSYHSNCFIQELEDSGVRFAGGSFEDWYRKKVQEVQSRVGK